MKGGIMALLLCSFSLLLNGQVNEDKDEYDENYEFPEAKPVNLLAGIGVGLDYGGLGARLTLLPVEKFGIFAAVGYNFLEAGFNGGVVYRVSPDKKIAPFFFAMYGYNSVIVVRGMDNANKTYYGPSLGGGAEIKRPNGHFWSVGLIYPVRSSEFEQDFDVLDQNPGVGITKPYPLQITLGYHFRL